MGAGYRTAKAQYIDDKMLKLPYQLMGQAIAMKDKGIDNTYAEIDAFSDLLSLKSLESDKDQATELVRGYQTQADELARNLMDNPLEYQKQMRKIRGMGRKLSEDMDRGKWAAIEDRYNTDVAYAKKLEELDRDKFDDQYKALKLREARKNAGSLEYDDNTGKYNKYQEEEVYALPDINERLEEYVKGVDPDVEAISYDQKRGLYEMTTYDGKTKTISDEKILGIVMNKYGADKELQNALQDRHKLGMQDFKDIYDKEGNLQLVDKVIPASVRGVDGRPKQFNRIKYSNNILGRGMQAIADKYRKHDTDFDTGIKAAPNAGTYLSKKLEDEADQVSPILTNKERVSNGIPSEQAFDETYQLVNASKKEVIEEAVNAFNMAAESEITPEQMASLRMGNFDILRELDKDYDPKQIQDFKNRFSQAVRQQAVMDGLYEEFVQTATPVYNINGYSEQEGEDNLMEVDGQYYHKNAFDNFLKQRSTSTSDIRQAWPPGTTDTKRRRYSEQIVSYAENGAAAFKPVANDAETVDQLISSGEVIFSTESIKNSNPEKAQVLQKFQQLARQKQTMRDNGRLEEWQESAEAEEYTRLRLDIAEMDDVTYEYVEGADFANFKLDKNSVRPDLDLGSDQQLNMRVNGKLGGKTVELEFTNVAVPEVQEYYASNREALVINQFQRSHQGSKAVPIPVGIGENNDVEYLDGIVYNPNEGVILRTYTKNGKEITDRIDIFDKDNEYAKLARNRLFGFDYE